MNWWQITLLIIAILLIAAGILYYFGRRLQKKADSQQGLIEQSKQVVSILVIDKKKMKLKDSNLPKIVQEQVPFYLKWRKLPLVKAKIGPQITTLMCEDRVFKALPLKRQVKVELAGIYIMALKTKPKAAKNEKNDSPAKKSSWLDKLKDKANSYAKKSKK